MKKESTPDELTDAIRKIHAGGKYVSSNLAERLLDIVQNNTGASIHGQLSDREYQVLIMIAQGKTVSEIAADPALSVKTNFRSRIMKKMGISTNAQLMHYTVGCYHIEINTIGGIIE